MSIVSKSIVNTTRINFNTKLSSGEVAYIRQLREEGMHNNQIATETGYCYQTILKYCGPMGGKIVNGYQNKHMGVRMGIRANMGEAVGSAVTDNKIVMFPTKRRGRPSKSALAERIEAIG